MRCPDKQPDSSLWAYLGDPEAVLSAQRLIEQKCVVDALAAATVRRIERYIVDDGAISATGTSARLAGAIAEARADARRVTLVIAGTGCLGTTLAGRFAVLFELLAAGFVVEDPSGSLHPTASTVALAQAAAGRGGAARHRRLETRSDIDV